MPTPGQELSSIDFESMIGGPLIAVVNAQAQSANSTVNFIKSVGFKPPANPAEEGDHASTAEPIYVSFQYPKEVVPFDPGDPNASPPRPRVEAQYEDQEIRVPFLTLLPIPYLRVEETTIDFNAKINSVQHRQGDTPLKVNAELEVKQGWFTGSARLKVTTAFQRNTQARSRVERTYSLAIHVRAVQDEMPAGMEKMLSILEDAIVSKPAAGAAPGPHPVDR